MSNIIHIPITDHLPNTTVNTTTVISIDTDKTCNDSDIQYLNDKGRNWNYGCLVSEIKDLARVHSEMNKRGHFYTLIYSWQDANQAKKSLELEDGTTITRKTKFKINPGCLVAVGQFMKNDNYQIYVNDSSFIEQIDDSKNI